ncbi:MULTISPECIES: TlpA family protein disulfide reductase [Streptomyces]|uniref:TlpA family protein disulfide reductase n=1 Tax=Streptomyces TaxID=1883 RepID=UPI00069AD8B5|nr:TlpA disulfide reductase family protein [Streptomyces sp. SID7805]MYU54692.1 redoxin family protein [Streptomyces sp. SID7805]
MSYLYPLVALVGALGVLNLAFTFGVVRRLREHTDLLSQRNRSQGSGPKVMLDVGETVEAFDAVTVDGTALSQADLATGATLVGVFAYGCSSCDERLPAFLELARSFPGGKDQVFAVVVGDSEHVAGKRDKLTPVARVVTEEYGGAVTAALGVKGYPAFALLNSDGAVTAAGTLVEDLNLMPAKAA